MNLHAVIIFTCLLATTLPFRPSRSGVFYQTVVDFDISYEVMATKVSDNSFECVAECLTIAQCEWIAFSKEESLCVLLKLHSENDSATVPNNAERWSDDVVMWFKKAWQDGNDSRSVATDQRLQYSVKDSGDTVSCMAPFVASENGCYLLVAEEKSWQEAEAHCQELGDHVHLVRPDTQQKRDEVLGLIGSFDFWIGANDTYGDNVIRYLGNVSAIIPDDSPLWSESPILQSWFHGRGDCVKMSSSGKYQLSACTNALRFVCQLDFLW